MSLLVFWLYKFLIVPLAWLLFQALRPFLGGKLREMIEDKNHGFYKIKKTGAEMKSLPPGPCGFMPLAERLNTLGR